MISKQRLLDLRVADVNDRTQYQISILDSWKRGQRQFFAGLKWMRVHPGTKYEDWEKWRDDLTVVVDVRIADLNRRLERIERIKETQCPT